MTETEIRGILHRIVERITERFRPEKIILFGSYARGAQKLVDLRQIPDDLGLTGGARVET